MNRFSVGISALLVWVLLLLGVAAADSPDTDAPGGAEPALPALQAPSQFPEYHGHVTDPMNMLRPEVAEGLATLFESLEDKSGIRMAVAIVPDIGNRSIEDYAVHLYDYWNLGGPGRGNGALLLVVRQQSGRTLPHFEVRIPDAGRSVETWVQRIYETDIDPRSLRIRFDYSVWHGARNMVYRICRFLNLSFALLEGSDQYFPAEYPEFGSLFTDTTEMLHEQYADALSFMLEDLHKLTGVRFFVAVVDAQSALSTTVYAQELFRRWGLSDRDLLLLVEVDRGQTLGGVRFEFRGGGAAPGVTEEFIDDVIQRTMRDQSMVRDWQEAAWFGSRRIVAGIAEASDLDPRLIAHWDTDPDVPVLGGSGRNPRAAVAQQSLFLALMAIILAALCWRGPAAFFRLLIGDPRPGPARAWAEFGDQRFGGGFGPFGAPDGLKFNPRQGHPYTWKDE